MKRTIAGLLAVSMSWLAMAVAVPPSALAAPTSAQVCEGGKNRSASKYVACLHKARTKLINGYLDMAGHDEDVLACEEEYTKKWGKLETAADGQCPSDGDAGSIRDFLDACVFSVEDALAGGSLPSDVLTCTTDLTTCQGDLSSTDTQLTTCESDLSSSNADLTTCQVDLSSTNADLTTCGSDLSSTNADLTTCQGDLSTATADLSSCETDLGDCEARPIGQLVKTEQVICQDGSGSVIPCGGTGLDGELQKGIAASFTDNGDGTVTDNNTLDWKMVEWADALHTAKKVEMTGKYTRKK